MAGLGRGPDREKDEGRYLYPPVRVGNPRGPLAEEQQSGAYGAGMGDMAPGSGAGEGDR